MLEYRVRWSASSNITFRDESEWIDWWGDDDATVEQVEEELTSGSVDCQGLIEALEASGFEWFVDVRERDSA